MLSLILLSALQASGAHCKVPDAPGFDPTFEKCENNLLRADDAELDAIAKEVELVQRDTRIGLCLLHYPDERWFVRMWHPHRYRRCERLN